MKYIMNWRTVTNAYDKVNLGRLTQTRISELYKTSGANISLAQTTPFGKLKLKRFRKLHEIYFKDFIDFEKTYNEINDNKR